ncbi:protein of unknown function, DUF285 [Oribacterium sp. KHPX15]|uniref:BspA family leucine-rich repeat surface protein n=1 Tax=Oribacterium sp. KHPX15 TaxID=1855342 RepID=UPI000899BF49|nr:BspA family leucine-rich repeat surface protein [Oribacterium sp. KHPX15]SEA79448.1 protein of unknown function, DUF285 [Oribacterium sp. KHPX15]
MRLKIGRMLLSLLLSLAMMVQPAWADDAVPQDDAQSEFYAVYNENGGMLHGQGSDATHIVYVQPHELYFIYSPDGVPRIEENDESTWKDAPICWKVPSSVASADDVPWKEFLTAGGVKSVRFGVSDNWKKMAPRSMNSWFAGATDLMAFTNANYVDTSHVTDFTNTFAGVATGTISGDEKIKLDLDLKDWDTSAATSMDGMFAGASGLKSIAMGDKFSSANLLSASRMFEGCTSLSGLFTLPSGFTLDKATALDGLFSGCSNLNGVIFPAGFTAGSATTIEGLFSGCTKLTRVDLKNFAPESCTNADDMFKGVESLNELKLGASSSLEGAEQTQIALPDTPKYWRFSNRLVPDGESEDATLTYPVGSILSPGELAELWDSETMAGTWVAYDESLSSNVINYKVFDGTGMTLALIQWREDSSQTINLSDGRGFNHARGIHQTGWTTDDPTVIEPGMAHVEPTFALGAHVTSPKSVTLYATYDANEFTVTEPAQVTFDGTDHTPELVLTALDGTPVSEDEVDIVWIDAAGKSVDALVECGTYTATVTPHADGDFAYALPKTVHLIIKKNQEPPTGLTAIKASSSTSTDGMISGVTDAMEYQKDGDIVWTSVGNNATEITGLTAGTYMVRYAETADKTASEATSVEVGIWSAAEKHNHTLEKVEAVEPGCETVGNKTYYRCIDESCDKWFEDETMISEITDKSSFIIKATGHKWGAYEVTKRPTYDEEGLKVYTCENDSSHTKEETIPRLSSSSSSSSDNDSDDDSDDSGSRSSSGYSSKSSASQELVDRINNVTSRNVPADHQAETGVPASDVGGRWANSADTDTWTYTKSDGTLAKSEWMSLDYNGLRYWYYFDASGNMQTNWFDYNGKKFYLMPDKDGWCGRMATGWKKIDNKWYYFDITPGETQGSMYTAAITPDGHTVGADGAWNGVGATPVGQE